MITMPNSAALAAALDEGLAHHRAGRLAEAEAPTGACLPWIPITRSRVEEGRGSLGR